jgi:hypothetical protein
MTTTRATMEAQMCPQVRHTVHASVTQADAIGSPLANADGLTSSSVGQPRIDVEECP